eukprot:1156986-Pelagomonas_calceolata.AAC.1
MPNSSSSCCSHHMSCSRHGTSQRTSVANCVRQPHQLCANQQHVHLIEIKYCEDTRPEQQLQASQHADLCKNISGKVSLYIPSFWVLVGLQFMEPGASKNPPDP